MDWAYAAVVALGALTLGIEAYRQFSNPLEMREAHQRYPILHDLSLDSLCTRAELVRGFIFYLCTYLVAYGAILGSAELAALARDAGVVTTGPTGSIALPTGEVFSDSHYGTPLIISASIVAALSTGLFAPVERVIRSFSHRLANIPRGVYRLLTRLSHVGYADIGGRYPVPLTARFRQVVAGQDHATGQVIDEAQSALVTIDLLAPSVIGELASQFFMQYHFATLDPLIRRLRTDLDTIRERLDELEGAPELIHELHQQVLLHRNNLLALFAVLYIRNGHRVASMGHHSPTREVVAAIERDHDPAIHSLTGAVLATFVLTIASTIGIYSSISTTLPPACAAAPERPQDFLALVSVEGLWFAVMTGMMFWLSGRAAILVQEARKERDRWDDWDAMRIPFARFAVCAILPALIAGVVCAAVNLVRDLWGVGILTTSQIFAYVQQDLPFCVATAGFGALIALYLFVVVDLHERLRATRTVALGGAFVLLYVGWAFLAVEVTYGAGQCPSFVVREILLLAAPAFFFFPAFALLIEATEK